MTAFDAPDVGAVLADRYELVRLIARGGMSDVYEATDRVLGRQAAVKLYRSTSVPDRGRFDVEVQILAGLNHPGLVHLYDAGEHGGDGYVVLELIDGPTLATVMSERGPLPGPEVREMGEAVADALAYVHAAGVVHRDVTPSNILCGSDGRARLADFGIARLLDTSRVTALANTVGTVAYMAPEQVEGGEVTAAADIYGLGLVILEALSGRRGFDGVGHEVAIARLTRDPDTATGVPEAWRPLLTEMTSRQAEARPTADEVRDRVIALPVDDGGNVTQVFAVAGAAVGTGDVAQTEVIPPLGGGTSVMPVAARPIPVLSERTHRIAWAAGAAFARWRRPLAVAAGVMLLVLVSALASAGGGDGSPSTSVPTAITGSSTVLTTVPTTAPPTTKSPKGGTGHGKSGNDD